MEHHDWLVSLGFELTSEVCRRSHTVEDEFWCVLEEIWVGNGITLEIYRESDGGYHGSIIENGKAQYPRVFDSVLVDRLTTYKECGEFLIIKMPDYGRVYPGFGLFIRSKPDYHELFFDERKNEKSVEGELAALCEGYLLREVPEGVLRDRILDEVQW